MPAHRISVCAVKPDECFVYDDDFGSARDISLIEIAAHQQGSAHGRKEAGKYLVESRIHVLVAPRAVVSLNVDRVLPEVTREHAR